MTDEVFVLGNGPSIKNIDIKSLKGKIYGCNDIYETNSVDVLVATDFQMCHKIYHSGYAFSNECYFSFWISQNEKNYDQYVSQMAINTKSDKIIKNEKEDSTEFVMHGVGDVKGTKYQKEQSPTTYVSWIKKDKVVSIESPCHGAGNMALRIACQIENPKKVYMMGMDFFAYRKNGNEYFTVPLNAPSDWLGDYTKIMNQYKDTQFIQVNAEIGKFEEWKNIKNLKYYQ